MALLVLLRSPEADAARVKPAPVGTRTCTHVSTARMAWWNELKFGMFIHWGPWSQTGIGSIWQLVKDPPGIREKRFELYRTFNPTAFDPGSWARRAKQAGMKYVIFVTKHHDGFSNWNTSVSTFSITNPETPYSKHPNPDLVRQIADAFRREGLAVGFYYSHIDWHHFHGKYFSIGHWDYDPSIVQRNPERWRSFVRYEKAQVRELLTRYGKIDILWFDISWPQEIPEGEEAVNELVHMIRQLRPDIILNDRGLGCHSDFETIEQRAPKRPPPGYWETSMTISDPFRRRTGGYWYKGSAAKYKHTSELLQVMGEIFSKGGNLLLNVGPRPDGLVPREEIQRLRELGTWMRLNGEAVYGTTRNPLPNVANWGFITRKDQRLYLWIYPEEPITRPIQLNLGNNITRAWLLADGRGVATRKAESGVDIIMPDRISDAAVSIVALEFEGELKALH